MADDRPSIEEILAMARSQDGDSGGPADTSEPADAEAAPAAEEAEAAAETPEETPEAKPSKPAAPAAKPSGVSDILAMARSQDSGGASETPAAEEAETPEETPEAKPAKPAAPAAKPSGASDILAMARAQDSSGTAETPVADAPPAKEAAAEDDAPSSESPASAGDGSRPSVQEMLQQLRQTDGAGQAAGPVSETTSERPMPVRPAAPEAPVAPPTPGRRSVLVALMLAPTQLIATPFAMAWTALTAACGAMVLGLARFMFPNTLVEPPMTFKIGPPSDYPPESVSTKFKAERGIWIVRSTMYNGQDQIVAISTVCTHLGCTPNWLEGEQKFKCPCHGSGFYKSGVNFEGPAPRPLERHGLQLAPDGMLEVDKSKKFQEELGQWEDGTSFVSS